MRLLLCLACLLLFQVEETRAQTATFEFSGHISYVGTTPEFPELASVFQVGRPYTLSYTFDYTTPDSLSAPMSGLYIRAITAASFNYDNSTYVGVMDPATMSGSIGISAGGEADHYIMVFGLGTQDHPTFNRSSAAPAFPLVGGFSFSAVRVNLDGPPSFLVDEGLHSVLNFEAAADDPLSFMSMSFRKYLNPISTAIMSINGTFEAFRVVRETNVVPRVYLNEVSSLTLTNFGVARFAVHGTRAFLLGYDELRVIDLSNRLHPRQISRQTGQGSPGDILATSNHVFVSDNDEGQVQIFENRDTPSLLTSFNLSTYLGEIEAIDNFAYVVWQRLFGEGGLRILDISNPLSPRLAGTWSAPRGANFALAVAGNVAYIASGRYVELLDVSNPAQPQSINSIPTPGHVNDVAVSGNYAYIGVHTNGVQIVDVSTPALPRTVAAVRLAFAHSLAVADNYLLVADNFNVLRLVDVTQPENPVLLDTFPGRDIFDVRIVGSTVYMLDYFEDPERQVGGTRLSILEIAPTAAPRLSVPHLTVAEDSGQQQIPILIDDPDTPLEALTVEVDSDSSVIMQPRVVSQEGGSYAISFRTRANRHGTVPFAIRVTDPDGHSVRESFHLHVSPVDDPPRAVISLSSPSFVQVAPGHFRITAFSPGLANVTVRANGPTDIDGDRLFYHWLAGVPPGADAGGRTLNLRLAPGTHYFSVEVTDGRSHSTANARVDIIPVHPQLRIPHRSGLISRPIAKGRPPFRPPPSPNR